MPRKPAGADYSNTEALGQVLYTEYVYPFEIAAVILLVAIIAAIALTLRRRPGTKAIDPSRQVHVSSKGRVRMVDMKSEGES
jgi:NADH-quinone oxidoreductase subunit J